VRHKLIVLALAAAVVVVVFLARAPQTGIKPPDPSAAASLPPSPPRTAAPAAKPGSWAAPPGAATSVMRGPVRLPPPATPVRDVIDQLKPHADAGEPRAACRLGMDLTRCYQARGVEKLVEGEARRLRSVDPASDEAARVRRSMEELTRTVAADSVACMGVPDQALDAAWVYLLRAGLAGNVTAMAQFATNPPLPYESVIDNIEGWTAYRDHAGAFLLRAVEAGDVRAAWMATFQSSTGMGPGGAVLPRDPQRALAFAYAIRPLVDSDGARQVEHVIARSRAEAGIDTARAERVGDALRARAFATAPKAASINRMGTGDAHRCAE
jgi:hypothetical protein